MEIFELIFTIVVVTTVTIGMFLAMLIELGVLRLPKWWTDILDEMERKKMLDPSGMLWDDPKIIEDTKSDEEKEILKLYKGMTPSMQKAIKDIMITTQIKEDKKDE